jgi:hypothetical protein
VNVAYITNGPTVHALKRPHLNSRTSGERERKQVLAKVKKKFGICAAQQRFLVAILFFQAGCESATLVYPSCLTDTA